MTFYYRIISHNIIIIGQTYALKEELKQIGGRYNKTSKVWFVSLNQYNLNFIKNLCSKYGGQELISFKNFYEDLSIPRLPQEDDINLFDNNVNLLSEKLNPDMHNHVTTNNNKKDSQYPTYTLSQLMFVIEKEVKNKFSLPIWIIGEIQNVSFKNNVIFFDMVELKHINSQSTISIKAKLWDKNLKIILNKNSHQDIKTFIQEHIKIKILCEVEFYKDRGQISLNVIDIDSEFSLGALALAKEKLLKELKQKGLYENNKKLSIVNFPFNIGLISAQNSRAKSDFLDQLKLYHFPGTVFCVNSQMQGEQTPDDVVKAINILETIGVDIIVITRGGGSAADLHWFNSEKIAYAIVKSKIPIISAIGHHDDTCIAEEVSYHREKTPTAAGDFIINIFNQTKELLETYHTALYDTLILKINKTEYQLNDIKQKLLSIVFATILKVNKSIHDLHLMLNKFVDLFLFKKHKELIQLSNALNITTKDSLNNIEKKLILLHQRLASYDPSPWLEKGWTRLYKNSQVIKSIKDVSKNQDELKAILKDGILKMVVIDIKERIIQK